MKKKVLFIAITAGLLMTSCASKKDLANCQTENKSLTEKLQDAREDLAGKNARIQALEDQQKGLQQALKAAEAKYAKLQESLDKSLTNASQNNISIEKLVDQINESRHCSISHFGVLVAPQMPTVLMSASHWRSISSGPSMRWVLGLTRKHSL